jgi:hypothetical protein
MRTSKWILLIVLAAALAHQSDGQQTRSTSDQLKLAGVMPRGALVYVQARDLSALMKTWLASPIREKFRASPSFKAFSESRVYLKFLDRKADIEKAVGVSIDEARLGELAGGASAVSIYDIGKLEMVFVTQVARERAIATALFKQLPQFQERSSDAGAYYAREFTTDNGNLNQQFCFAYADGKLIVTTTEGLMIRALKNVRQSGDDSALADVLATADRASDFTANEVTLWLDQSRLNQNRHFRSYWIHHNSLANIQTGLIDLRITPQALGERRWFTLKDQSSGAMLTAEQASGLIRMAPANAQLVEARALSVSREELNAAVSQTLFGKLPDEASISNQFSDRSSSEDESSSRAERYSKLDTRFDIDVDDEAAPRPGKQARQPAPQPAVVGFEKTIDAAIASASPVGYCEMARSRAEAGRPFVRFERAVVIEMKEGASIDRAAFERAVTDEMRSRFVVAGIDPQLQWQEEAGVRYLAQSLLEQGAAYSISGRYAVLSSSREMVRDILQAARTQTQIDGPASFYAVVRIADAKPVFDTLMKKLDGPVPTSEEESTPVRFFSDNLSSLIAATAFREMRIRRESASGVMIERVTYSW